jgi:hypothetical protein
LLAGASPAAGSGRSSRLVLSFVSGTSSSKQFLQWMRVNFASSSPSGEVFVRFICLVLGV